MSRSTNWLAFTTLVVSSLLVGCGGDSNQENNIVVPPPKIDIAVTPSAASIPIANSIDLQATGSSLVQGVTVDWIVGQDPSCTVIADTVIDFPVHAPCPSGLLWVKTPTGNLP